MIDYNKLYGRDEEFRKEMRTLPFLNFPSHWYVQIIGPFTGAAIRFRVSLSQSGEDSVSIYADFHDRLGVFGEPHWELYPDADGDNSRYELSDVGGLFQAIEDSLNQGGKK